jgi:ATP-dependent Clp protease ATP-binding subunit ClpA
MTNASNTSTSSVTDRLARLCLELSRRIQGRAEVPDRLLEAVIRRKFDTVPHTGCREALFFAGRTGVGKTKTARLLATLLFGTAAFVQFVLLRGFSPELGARPLLDTIHELAGNAIANDPLEGGRGNRRLVIERAQLRLAR